VIREPAFRNREAHGREPVRILLLEDDTHFAELLRAQLRRMPWFDSRLEAVGTLAEALARLAAESFGLVITDLNVPDSSGLDTVAALVRTGEQPIVVLTGNEDPALRVGAMDLGAYELLSKDRLSAAVLERLLRLAAIQANAHRLLRDSETRFDNLLKLSTDWYWEQDEQFRFTRFDGRVDEILGSDSRAVLGKRRWEIPSTQPVNGTWEEHRALVEAHRPFRNFETRRVGDDGAVHHISATGEPVFDAGDFRGYRGIATDITQSKLAEAAYRQTELQFRQTFELAASGIAHVDLNGLFLRLNPRLCEILGYTESELIGRSVKQISHPDDRDVTDVQRARMRAGEVDAVRLEKRYLRRDGSTIWVDLTVALARDAHGAPLYEISVVEDVTQRKAAVAALRESEQRFRSLIELSSDFYWESDPEHRVVKVEHGSQRHPVVNPAQLGKARWETPSTYPDAAGWAAHRATMDAHLAFSDFEIARLDEDGVARWRSISGEPVFDDARSFMGYRGIGRDITARKRAEEELQRFRLAMDNSADIILLVDCTTLRYVDVNTTACRLLGYSRDELLAMGPADILPVSREQLAKTYGELIKNPSQASGMRSEYRCKDGSALPFESTRHVLRSGDGWLVAAISRDIRERIAAETALRESEARFRSLNALSSDWYWEQDDQFRLTYMSSIEKTGLEATAYLGRKRWDQPALNLTEADWARHRAQLERHEPFRDFEMQRSSADGGTVWLSLSGEPMFDGTGRFTGYRGVGRDITQRKRIEAAVIQLERRYAALGQANEAVLRADSPQEVFERACDVAVSAGGFQLVTVFAHEAATGRLTREAASGPAAGLVKDIVPKIDASQPGGGGILGHATRTGRPAISNDYAADPRTEGRRDEVRNYRVGSAAAFPLHVGGEVVAVFGVQHAERNAFSEELTGLLQRLADNISFALENFRGEAKRKQAKRGLHESEARFRSLTGLSSDMYWEQDDQYRFTSLSGPSPLGAERGRMVGKQRWDDKCFNMTQADWAAHRADLDARRPFRDLELGRVNAAGEKVWVSVSGEAVFDDGGVFKGYRGVAKDISKRKREEVLLRLEHAVTRRLADAENSSSALREVMQAICESEDWECGRYFAVDEKGELLRFREGWGVATPAVEEFLERARQLTYRPGQGLTGWVWQHREPLWVSDVSKDPRASGSSRSRSGKSSLQGGSFVFPVIAEGKTIGVLSFTTETVRPPDERMLHAVNVIGSQVGQFVQRKKGEEVLRESEARFRSLTSLSSDWYWEQDADFRFTTFEGRGGSDEYAPATAVLGKRVWELDGLVRESFDLEAHRARLERHEPFRDVEYEYRDHSGGRFYIRVDGEPVFDHDGHFAGYRGTSRDITQQRRGEEELRRFRAAMDMSHDAIYLTDRATMRFVDVNKVGCKSLGYTREQLLGMGPHEVLSAPRDQLEREYDAVIAEGSKAVRLETSYVPKDGRKLWTELHRRALRSGDNWIIVTISRDITERKRAEERQAAHLRYQERVARFGQAALVKAEPAELVEKAVQAVLEALGADAVAYLETEPGVGGMTLRAVVGVADAGANPGAVALASGDPIAQVMQSGTPVLTDGASLPLAWARDLRSAALVPVRGDDKVRGVLCACYKRADAFAAEELNFVEATASVLSTAMQRIDSEGRLAYLAQFDPLTGLPNRTLLADRFSQMIVQAKRRNSPLGVLFIDLDEFKMVNDTLGHAGGDALLKEVAVRLQSTVRTGDTVARISGDEFAIVLADLARPEDAALVAQKVIDRLAAAVEIHGNEVFVTASVGVALFPGDGADAEALIGAADAAMYRAKQSGRNAYQFFTAEINQRSRARSQMGVELRHALEREEFVLFYQPKYELADRRPSGAEALLRWKHPERGTVSPAEFIPVLEETGLIVPVGEWVLRRACEDLKAWQAAGLSVGPVSVNLSARQFRQQDLDVRLKSVVAAAGVDPALIELEITESQLMQDPDHAIRVMRAMRDAGMRIAIDDFGTGFSSLSYLTRFPVSSLKIDRSFVKDMTSDSGHATIVRTIIEMAHTLGFNVIAEGVETEDQATLLRLLRCEQAQGYLFAKPMPAVEFATLLARGRGQALSGA
jgi:diguanylate cyclase (GGDEF)-like protein/PAS domain S-box-containing protein